LLGTGVSEIELTGLGGLTHFAHSLPRSALARSAIYLAGPAANLILWLGLGALADQSAGTGQLVLATPLAVLASANFFLLCFNLLPAYPLDGGRTLDAWLGALFGGIWSTRIVAVLGLAIAVGIALLAIPSGIFLLLIALVLAQANWEALRSVGRWR
jgi:Zn-dependent protease